jgi:hypothetical protein
MHFSDTVRGGEGAYYTPAPVFAVVLWHREVRSTDRYELKGIVCSRKIGTVPANHRLGLLVGPWKRKTAKNVMWTARRGEAWVRRDEVRVSLQKPGLPPSVMCLPRRMRSSPIPVSCAACTAVTSYTRIGWAPPQCRSVNGWSCYGIEDGYACPSFT